MHGLGLEGEAGGDPKAADACTTAAATGQHTLLAKDGHVQQTANTVMHVQNVSGVSVLDAILPVEPGSSLTQKRI